MMRALLAALGAVAALLLSRAAENFDVISATIFMALFSAIVVIAVLSYRK